eukprot:TRINITY_DN3798_c0_g1_i7.p1 TRINITY_DN3798_c0_g1~~TRINITY_DN3798_c0_g1_i7.p1  ORF type:complete len:777 (-),score=132.65 TRINITY_DN3798_c0_g1_i7:1-2331(-)
MLRSLVGSEMCIRDSKGTVSTFAMRIASLVNSGAGGGKLTCSSNTMTTRLDGRTYLRGSTQLADITLGAGTPTVKIWNNTLTTTTGTSLSTLNTATMASTYSITPVTLCGSSSGSGGVVAVRLASTTLMPSSGLPVVAVDVNTISVQATQEAWGVCSVVLADFAGTPATGTLVDVYTNTMELTTSTDTSLTGSWKVVSFTGSVVQSPDVDFVAVRDNRFKRTVYTTTGSESLAAPRAPALVVPASVSVTAGSPLQWWACRNIIELSDGVSSASTTIRSPIDVQRTSEYDPAQHLPTHCFTDTRTGNLSFTTTLYTRSLIVTRTATVPVAPKIFAAAKGTSPLNSPPVLASSSAALGAATMSASEGAASLQVLVIITTMSCRTQGASRSDGGGSSLLSPVSIPGLGPSREMVGSLILVVAIIGGYFAITHFIFAMVRKFTLVDMVTMRLWKARLYTLYPRIPLIAASLLMPGIIFDGASLLYGDTSGVAVWWERLLGAVAILLSALVVVYHIAVGRLARAYISDAISDLESSHNNKASSVEYSNTKEVAGTNGDVEMVHHSKVTVMGNSSMSSVGGEEVDYPQDNYSDNEDSGAKYNKVSDDVVESDNECNADPIPPSTDELPPFSSLIIEAWLYQFSDEVRSIIPKAVRVPLLPRRRWAPQVGRTMYCVLTSLRPEAASYVAAHSILRVFLVGMLAAVNPGSTHSCTVVESVLAGLCFIHGIAVLTLRIFRVSALTVLQGLQSFVLGLVAIIPYLGGDMADIGTGLTITLLSLIHI